MFFDLNAPGDYCQQILVETANSQRCTAMFSAGSWCMNQFGTRTELFGGLTYSPTIAWDSGLPSSAIRFNTLHPILASRFCDS